MRTVHYRSLLFTVITAVVFIAVACEPEKKETYQTGDITLYAEESIAPVIQKEARDFMAIYKKAKITVISTTARGAIVRLVSNQTKLAIIPRDLDSAEQEAVRKYAVQFKKFRLAIDGLAVIVNKANPVDSLTTQQLGEMFSGRLSSWKQLRSPVAGEIVHAMTGPNTASYEMLMKQLPPQSQWSASMRACTTSTQIIESVRENRNMIGYIGLSWLNESGTDGIKLVKVGDAAVSYDSVSASRTLLPYQYYLWKRVYPFTRDVFAFSTDQQSGLAAGFTVFLMNAGGQKTFLQAGMVPGNPSMPIKLIATGN